MELKILDVMLIISISLLTSFSINLNAYSKDKESKCIKNSVYYISNALISGITGLIFGLLFSVIQSNRVLCIVASCIGSYSGTGGLNIVSKFILHMLEFNDTNDKDNKK